MGTGIEILIAIALGIWMLVFLGFINLYRNMKPKREKTFSEEIDDFWENYFTPKYEKMLKEHIYRKFFSVKQLFELNFLIDIKF